MSKWRPHLFLWAGLNILDTLNRLPNAVDGGDQKGFGDVIANIHRSLTDRNPTIPEMNMVSIAIMAKSKTMFRFPGMSTMYTKQGWLRIEDPLLQSHKRTTCRCIRGTPCPLTHESRGCYAATPCITTLLHFDGRAAAD